MLCSKGFIDSLAELDSGAKFLALFLLFPKRNEKIFFTFEYIFKMMKLLSILWVFFSFLLVAGPGGVKAMPGEKVTVVETISELPHFSDFSKVTTAPDPVQASVWMIKALASGKQLDLPNDTGKGWCHLICRNLHPGSAREWGEGCPHLSGAQFLCFLAGRHLHGFYIYSLEKLIL